MTEITINLPRVIFARGCALILVDENEAKTEYAFMQDIERIPDFPWTHYRVVSKDQNSVLAGNKGDFEKIEAPNPHSDYEWPAHSDYDIYVRRKS